MATLTLGAVLLAIFKPFLLAVPMLGAMIGDDLAQQDAERYTYIKPRCLGVARYTKHDDWDEILEGLAS